MLTKQTFAGLLLGSAATVAVGLGFLPRTAPEAPSVWHEVLGVPRGSADLDAWWRNLGTSVWREQTKHPHDDLFVSCSLKQGSVRIADAAASGKRGDHVNR